MKKKPTHKSTQTNERYQQQYISKQSSHKQQNIHQRPRKQKTKHQNQKNMFKTPEYRNQQTSNNTTTTSNHIKLENASTSKQNTSTQTKQ